MKEQIANGVVKYSGKKYLEEKNATKEVAKQTKPKTTKKGK